MKELERSEFDEQWKGAFEEAAVPPATSVWSNLDRELTLAEGKESKRRVLFYQRLAAASVVFALMAGSFGVYHWRQNENQLALNSISKSNDEIQSASRSTNEEPSSIKNTETKANSANAVSKLGGAPKKGARENTNLDFERLNKSGLTSFNSEKKMVELNDDQGDGLTSRNETKNKNDIDWLAANRAGDLALLPFDSIHGGPKFVDIIRKLPAMPALFMTESKKNNFNHEKLWASVVAATGTYSDNKGSSSYSVSSTQPSSSSYPTGNSYTVGMLGGMRVAKRWVLQSGVQYMNQSAGYSSNISSGSLNVVANTAHNSSAAPSGFVGGSPYDIVSTNQFVSVPVQAGYLLIDKKFGWQINPGVATDFFVRNTLSDPSGQRQSYSQGAGSDSPYRSVNFSGLMSSEVSYKLSKSYRVSLVPGIRYFFNPVLKSQTSGNPFVWDVGFRFRYIFK